MGSSTSGIENKLVTSDCTNVVRTNVPEQMLKQMLNQILPQPILLACMLLEQIKMFLEQILVEQMLVQKMLA